MHAYYQSAEQSVAHVLPASRCDRLRCDQRKRCGLLLRHGHWRELLLHVYRAANATMDFGVLRGGFRLLLTQLQHGDTQMSVASRCSGGATWIQVLLVFVAFASCAKQGEPLTRVADGKCWIADASFDDGVVASDGCQRCVAPQGIIGSWGNLTNGTACDGGLCWQGNCSPPCTGRQDGTACNNGFCVGGSCLAGCWIDGGFMLPTVDVPNSCAGCIPDASMTSLSTFPEDTPCTSTYNFTSPGVCFMNGWDSGRPTICTCTLAGAHCPLAPYAPYVNWVMPCCDGECGGDGYCCTTGTVGWCWSDGNCCNQGTCVMPTGQSHGTCSWDAGGGP